MAKHLVWVSFDLGIHGDYEGMYTWLDQHKAKECGDSVACFWYEHPGDLLQDIKQDLTAKVSFNTNHRVYVIRLEDGKPRGKFILGGRRAPPWAGHAPSEEQGEDMDA
jgi:hypothetical protein